jgi:hypothetical protein
MSTTSEERRRVDAALARALDANPDVAHSATRDAVHAFVDAMVADGMLPEAVVIAFKASMARVESLYAFASEQREQLRSALVSACIARYFSARTPDDVRITASPKLRLVREEEAARREAPDASV